MTAHRAPNLPRVPVVRSTNIKGVGYDPEKQVMDVEFHSGGVYRYWGVPQMIHQGLIGSVSKGDFFRAQVRGRFRHEQLTPS